jgi:hypothetical protein
MLTLIIAAWVAFIAGFLAGCAWVGRCRRWDREYPVLHGNKSWN